MPDKDRLEAFQLFYQEIPSQSDELDDITIVDIDNEDSSTEQKAEYGLSYDQVSRLSQDVMDHQATKPSEPPLRNNDQRQLFEN